jgi:hypothetical protein
MSLLFRKLHPIKLRRNQQKQVCLKVTSLLQLVRCVLHWWWAYAPETIGPLQWPVLWDATQCGFLATLQIGLHIKEYGQSNVSLRYFNILFIILMNQYFMCAISAASPQENRAVSQQILLWSNLRLFFWPGCCWQFLLGVLIIYFKVNPCVILISSRYPQVANIHLSATFARRQI